MKYCLCKDFNGFNTGYIIFKAYGRGNPAGEEGKCLRKDGIWGDPYEFPYRFNSRRYLISVLKKQSPSVKKTKEYGHTTIVELWEDSQ